MKTRPCGSAACDQPPVLRTPAMDPATDPATDPAEAQGADVGGADVGGGAPSGADQARVLRALSALASDLRLDLLRLLIGAGPEGLAAGEIARALGASASRLSFHLAQMEQAGLIASRRMSRHVIYAADTAGIGAIFGWLLADCCCNHPQVRASCSPHCRCGCA